MVNVPAPVPMWRSVSYLILVLGVSLCFPDAVASNSVNTLAHGEEGSEKKNKSDSDDHNGNVNRVDEKVLKKRTVLFGIALAYAQDKCAKELDIVMVLDSSGSIGRNIFENKLIPSAVKLVEKLDISETNVHVSLVRFSSVSKLEFNFLHEKKEVLEKVGATKYKWGYTYLDRALNMTRNEILEGNLARKDATKMVIIWTDGWPSAPLAAEKEVAEVKKTATILVIGIGLCEEKTCVKIASDPSFYVETDRDNLEKAVLKLIPTVCECVPSIIKGEWSCCSITCGQGITQRQIEATDKNCKWKRHIETEACQIESCFSLNATCKTIWGSWTDCSVTCGSGTTTRTGTVNEMTSAIGKDGKPCNEQAIPTTETKNCYLPECRFRSSCQSPLDVVFMLDCSTSVEKKVWIQQVLPFVQKFAFSIDVSEENVHVGLFQYSNNVQVEWNLDENHDQADLMRAILKVEKVPGNTHTSEGLKYAGETMFKENGARPTVPKLLVILTDGWSYDFKQVEKETEKLKSDFGANLTISVVGVGYNVNDHECRKMASKPELFQKTTFANLRSLTPTIVGKTCSSIK